MISVLGYSWQFEGIVSNSNTISTRLSILTHSVYIILQIVIVQTDD